MPRPRTFDVDYSWSLPDPALLLPEGTTLVADVTTARATFFDTAERTLHRRGITVVVADGVCTVRLPADTITVAAVGRAVPREIQQLLLGVRGGRRLLPIAKTETLRGITQIVGTDGELQGGIVDEAITATTVGTATISEQRREITLTASDKTLRTTLRKALTSAGARPVDRPRGEHVLALTSLGPAAHQPRPAAGTIGTLVTDYLDDQVDALLAADIGLRRGEHVVHAARVATRRYRSALRVFADLVDADRTQALDLELQWLAQQLGAVRDAEVQRAHLDEAVRALPDELVLGPVAARIDEHLLAVQLKARARVEQLMRGRRYLALLAELEQWRDHPPTAERATRPAAGVRTYLRQSEAKLAKRLRQVAHADDATLHRARKAAKRTRYTAELAAPALGKAATRTVNRAKKLQDVLGEHQDSVVASALLLQLGRGTARAQHENGFTFGLLFRAERDRADRCRSRAVRVAGKAR